MTERTRLAGAIGAARDVPTLVRQASGYERIVKPVVDRVVASLLLLALLPLFVLVALGVLMTLGRPFLYRQTRVGFQGEHFTMLKFRSMRRDRRREENPRYHGPDRRRRHKTQDDPRHTSFGRFIRRFSLDELPQLWNVVRGDLSLIGPRPELPQVVAGYEDWQHQRHAVRPGVTGLWQVTERDHDGEMHKHVSTDLRYVHALSPRLDAWIALRTIPAILGAPATRGPRFLDVPAPHAAAASPANLRVAEDASVA